MLRILAACLCSLGLLCAVPASAQTPTAAPEVNAPDTPAPTVAREPAAGGAAYAGTWADEPAQCAKAQDVEDAPMVVTKDRFDQHEAHCEFTSVSGNGNEWKVSSKCSVEGDEQAYDFGMSLADDKLTMLDDAGSHVYTRCP